MEYTFTEEDLKQVDYYKSKYPTNQSAVMAVLWYAQDKFGHVEPQVQKLVAETLELPPAHVHGVASFYTQYYKKELGKFVIDVCTSFSCQVMGGYKILHYLEEQLGIKAGETTDDGLFSLQQVECLGACGYAPMLQVTNDKYVNHLTEEKVDKLLANLKDGKELEFEEMRPAQMENEG
jgi:NADH-quinone oxidoreductase subunit E